MSKLKVVAHLILPRARVAMAKPRAKAKAMIGLRQG